MVADALLCLFLTSALTLTACKVDHGQPSDTTGATDVTTGSPGLPSAPITGPDGESDGVLIRFENSAGVHFESDRVLGQRVSVGDTITFTLRTSPFYEGKPTVYAGEAVLTAGADGVYSLTAEQDVVIRVEGVSLKSSEMEGDGDSSSDPYLITSPVDLLYIAEQVNGGNAAYVSAYYKLENDLDFQGEELAVIGDGSSDAAVFAGFFNGNGHTISNYRIEADGTQYVGLFGVLQADVSGGSGGTINNLHLKDFTMTVSAAGVSCFCGSLVGYGMGGNLLLCSAENGEIELYADSNRFAYAGGLVGIQQALDYNSLAYYSSVSYCHADVAVNCNSGSVFVAGGLIGYLSASNLGVTASLNNSYFTGSVCGAMRAGGIAGYMTAGTSIAACYSIGQVSAQSFATDAVNSKEFCFAYAGGLVGYAEAGTAIAEAFSTSELSAKANLGSDYEVTDGVLAFAADPEEYDFVNQRATVWNCVYNGDGSLDLTDGTYLQTTLCWNPYDWVFETGTYPTVNVEEHTDYTFTISLYFDGALVSEVADFSTYMPLNFWYADGDLPSRLSGENDGAVSYGYFFDAACTLAIPDSFVPMHDMKIYAAVANVSDVVGEYRLLTDSDSPLSLTLKKDGTFTYSDAGAISVSTYRYDGKRIIFEDARFARFCGAQTIGTYQLYTFSATYENGEIRIVGGVSSTDTDTEVYYTADAPLVAIRADRVLAGTYGTADGVYTFRSHGSGVLQTANGAEPLTYTRTGDSISVTVGNETKNGIVTASGLTLDGVALRAADAFIGSWTVDSKAQKVYTFDGFGNWTYTYYGYRVSGGAANREVYETLTGTYTIDAGDLILSGARNGKAVWTSDGALAITVGGEKISCHQDGGRQGTWVYEDYGLTLTIGGIGKNGQGSAHIDFLHANGTLESYDLVCAIDEMRADTLCLYIDGEVFGYLTYQPERDCLRSMLYVGTQNSFMDNVSLQRLDEYRGEWIADSETMPEVKFDGLGAYGGTVTVGTETAPYTLDRATLSGSFVLNGKVYLLAYRESDGAAVLTQGGIETVYRRKDAYADLTLIDGNGNLYRFDGRGELPAGGTMTNLTVVGGETYTYFVTADGLSLQKNGISVGSLVADSERNEYCLTVSGNAISLRIKTRFTGFWGMFGSIEGLTIGSMGLDGTMDGEINGTTVRYTMQADDTLKFTYQSSEFYVIPVGDVDLVISPYKDWYLYSGEVICSPVDDLFGMWKNALGGAYRFDGLSGSLLTNGSTETGTVRNDEFTSGANYFYYSYVDGRYILWTVNSTTGETEIYRLNFCDPSTKRAYVSEDGTRAFLVEQGDRLYNMEVTDSDTGIAYSFDGFGTVTTSDGKTYAYATPEIDYVNGIATTRLTGNGETWLVTIDFSGANATIEVTAANA